MASIGSPSSPNGAFHVVAPKEFDGKKETSEEFSIKLKAYLSIMNIAFKQAMVNIEDNLEQEVIEAYFSDRIQVVGMAYRCNGS